MEDRLDGILDTLLEVRTPFAGTEQELSLALYRQLARGEPVAPEAAARAAGVDRARVDAALSRAPGIYRDDQGRVTGYWGLTVTETPHRMLVEGRRAYTWCAWDTLFLPELLGSPAQVESSCPVTGKRIALEVGPEGAVSEGAPPPVSFIVPDPRKAAVDIVRSFCHYIFFFAGDAAAREWSAAHPGTVIATLEQAWELGRRRNARCYPGREFGFVRRGVRPTPRSTTAASRPA